MALSLVLCGSLLAGCAGNGPEVAEQPLGWGGPIAAREVQRWSKESLAAAARWSIAEAPSFVVIPDSFPSWEGRRQQRYVAGARVLPDGRIVVLHDGDDPDSLLLRIFDPVSGEEVKVAAPKGEDGQTLEWGDTDMAVEGDKIILMRDIQRSRSSEIWSANQKGEFTGVPAHVSRRGLLLLGVFPDGSLAILAGDGWEMRDTTLVSSIVSARAVPAGQKSSDAAAPNAVFTTAMARDTTDDYHPLFGAHDSRWAVGLAGDTIWIVPTDRPELVAVHQSGAILLKVEWEAGDRTIPSEIGVVFRKFEEERGDSTVEYMRESWGLVEEGVVRPRSERFPAARRLVIGADGLLYVQRVVWDDAQPRAGPEWLVFTPAGGLVARLDIARNLEVLAFGPGSVVVRGVNAVGAQEVRVYELTRPSRG